MRIKGLTKRYSCIFEWKVKATLNLLTYQILYLQGASYKTGIQAGPTIHTFLFSYFSLHFHENALLLHAGGSDFRLYDGSDLKTSIDEMVGA